MRSDAREFTPDQMESAKAFIADLPQTDRRIYVDVSEGGPWRFVYGDDRDHVARLLSFMTDGRPFRLRGFDGVTRLLENSDYQLLAQRL